MATLKLLLLRHAESIGNQCGQMEGWSPNPLSPLGQQQAACLGQYLRDHSWPPTHLYCSPLRRAAETLALVGQQWGWPTTQADPLTLSPPVPLVWSDDLKEYQNGILQGLTWAEAEAAHPALCQQLMASADWLPIPGAESLVAGRARAARLARRLLVQHQNGDRLWIVAHQWILQQLLAVLLGCDRTWGVAMPPTALFELWLDRQRWPADNPNRWNSELWQIKRFSDCQHLDRSL